eukprot:COSAG01_NODE_645_length_14553_cov_32.925227_3_plen_116_part_00
MMHPWQPAGSSGSRRSPLRGGSTRVAPLQIAAAARRDVRPVTRALAANIIKRARGGAAAAAARPPSIMRYSCYGTHLHTVLVHGTLEALFFKKGSLYESYVLNPPASQPIASLNW